MPQFDPNYRPAGSPRKPLGDPNRPAGSPRKPLGDPNRPAGSPRQSGGFFRSHFGGSRPPQSSQQPFGAPPYENPYQKPYPRREPGWDARAHRPARPPRGRSRWREYDHQYGYDRMPGYDPGLYDDEPPAFYRSEPLPRDFARPPYAHPDPRPLPPHVRRRGCCGGCAAQAAAMLAAVGGVLMLLLHG